MNFWNIRDMSVVLNLKVSMAHIGNYSFKWMKNGDHYHNQYFIYSCNWIILFRPKCKYGGVKSCHIINMKASNKKHFLIKFDKIFTDI